MESPLNEIVLLLIGMCVGTIGTLIGAGGGFILMPVLLIFGLVDDGGNPRTLSSLSLAVVMLNAMSGSFAYMRMGRIDYKSGLLFAIATLPGAFFGAKATALVPKEAFGLIFGLFMSVLAVYLFLRSRQTDTPRPLSPTGFYRMITERKGIVHEYSYNLSTAMVISLGVGFLSSFLGIGGGVIHVPVLNNILHFPLHIATATSQFTLAFMALEGTIINVMDGVLQPHWHEALWIGIGAVTGAQVGARLSSRLKGRTIVRVLAGCLVIVGFKLVMSAV